MNDEAPHLESGEGDEVERERESGWCVDKERDTKTLPLGVFV